MTAPLFILSPPRSFTSVTCGMVGNHPEMLGVAELNLFARDTVSELHEFYRYRPRYQHGLLRTMAELGLGEQTPATIEAAGALLDEMDAVSTAEVFQDLMAWASPRAIVDKSPLYVINDDALPRIGKAFPDARFLHLLRHPRGTCESIYKLRQKLSDGRQKLLGREGPGAGGAEALSPENMWLNPHQRVVRFLETIPAERKMRIHGEILLSDPERYLAEIADWLDISTDSAAIERMLHPEDSPFACLGPENAKFGNDPDYLENPALRPYQAKELSLDGPLSWDNTLEFSSAFKHFAVDLGYE